jgi:hypothetical protein
MTLTELVRERRPQLERTAGRALSAAEWAGVEREAVAGIERRLADVVRLGASTITVALEPFIAGPVGGPGQRDRLERNFPQKPRAAGDIG